MGRIGTALGIAALGGALPVAAAVQSVPAQSVDVDLALNQATRTYRDKGYSPAGWQKNGSLANATDVRETISLKGGKSYHIVAACDKKCTDLDLQLFDAAGKEVDWDAQDDNFPIVTTYAQTTQVYTVRVVMSACGKGACVYGAKAFIKN